MAADLAALRDATRLTRLEPMPKPPRPSEPIDQVIIGGLPRSGTSLMRGILGSHPEIAVFKSELPYWTYLYPKYAGRRFTREGSTALLDEFFESYTIATLDVEYTREEVTERLFASEATMSVQDLYDDLVRVYCARRGRPIFGLKTPYNELHAETILRLYPKSRFVHVVRNPLDAAASHQRAKELWWGGSLDVHEHITAWRRSTLKGLGLARALPHRYRVVRYEDMVADPVTTFVDLCEFLGVAWDSRMLAMEGQPGWSGSNSSYADDGLSRGPRARPAGMGGVEQAYAVLLGELMHELRYDVPPSPSEPRVRLLLHGRDRLASAKLDAKGFARTTLYALGLHSAVRDARGRLAKLIGRR